MTVEENKNSVLADVIRPGVSRGLDFVNLEELRKRTGVNPDEILKFATGEMLCNSLDTDATEIGIVIEVDDDFCTLTVADNGTKKLTLEEIKLVVDFERKASSKRGLLRVTRGYLGNALKCIIGYSYALCESLGVAPQPVIVESGNNQYGICLKPDRIREIIESDVAVVPREDNGCNTFTVKFPRQHTTKDSCELSNPLKDLVSATAMVNPTREITFKFLDRETMMQDEAVFGCSQNTRGIRQETSILWYDTKQFTTLYQDFLKARPETQIKDFIALFRGFAGKKVIKQVLDELRKNCTQNHDSGSVYQLQFFPATPLKNLTPHVVKQLFAIMKAKSKPIAKRSIPSVLGYVSESNFEKIRQQNGWERLRYVLEKGNHVSCPNLYDHRNPCNSPDHVEYPYLIEIAIFDRKPNDTEGLRVYQCVNFMASFEDIFSRIFDISYRLGRAGVTRQSPVTVVVHLVCPVLKWLNYGKSGLDE